MSIRIAQKQHQNPRAEKSPAGLNSAGDTTASTSDGLESVPDAATWLVELIKIAPSVLWVALAGIAFACLYRPLTRDVLPLIRKFKGFGLEFEFAERELLKAAKAANVVIDRESRARLLRRIGLVKSVLEGAQILWVDDEMSGNRAEVDFLKILGASINETDTTSKAINKLNCRLTSYDVILSDMKREDNDVEGIEFALRISQRKDRPPIIIYTGTPQQNREVPAHVFGITNRPDELFHLTIDALERRRI